MQTLRPPARNRAAQAERFEAFLHDFNHERPHEALGQLPPARLYAPSHRPMPDRLPRPEYPAGTMIRRIRTNGEITWRGGFVQICSALAGEHVAIEELERSWRVWFHQTPIASIDADTAKVSPIYPG